MSNPPMPIWQRWAQFRHSVIGELLVSPPPTGQLQQALRRLSQKIYSHPIDSNRKLSLGLSTIERWYYKARGADDPISVLGRKIRSDAGIRWSMPDAILEALKTQYKAYSRWTTQLHYDNLEVLVGKQPELGKLPSYKTVLRCMRDNGWLRSHEPAQPTNGQLLAAKRLEQREVRSFEVPYVHGLWHLDFHHAKVRILDASGNWHQPMALAIMDDYSRLCCHLQFYLNETAECLIHGLTQAFMKRGLPRALMTDNGSAMLAEETTQGLGRLGIDHKTTLPYSPYQNGKQEVLWSQLEGRLLELLRGKKDLKLSFLNRAGQAWVEQDYHRRFHREMNTTPMQRMLSEKSVARKVPDKEVFDLAFTRRISRKPRRSDATVMVYGIRYELPVRFAHLKSVVLRAPGWDKSHMTLVDPKTDAPLARLLPQDKTKNASGKRRVIQPKTAKETSIPVEKPSIPLLLEKWMADYAATGLPPAYLPKEENTIE
nr:DDE-type integrase/transposase/recombinase [Pseudodesulfovibrio sp.]